MTRGEAYRWLARGLGLTSRECHISMFNVTQCKSVVEFARSLR